MSLNLTPANTPNLKRSFTKLTPEISDILCTAVSNCLPIREACKLADIDSATFYRWLQLGQNEEEPYATFRRDMDQAQAKWQLNSLQHIQRWQKDNWTAAAWLLERRLPEYYGKQERLQVDASVSITVADFSALRREAIDVPRGTIDTPDTPPLIDNPHDNDTP